MEVTLRLMIGLVHSLKFTDHSKEKTVNREPLTVNKRRRRLGFSLVELLVVVAILGVLASITSFTLVGHQKRARDAQRKNDLQQIKKALQSTKNDCKGAAYYPFTTASDLSNARNAYDHLVTDLVTAKYLSSKFNDPKSTPALLAPYSYQYFEDYEAFAFNTFAGRPVATYCPSLSGLSYIAFATETALLRAKLEDSKDPDLVKAFNNCPKLAVDTSGGPVPGSYYINGTLITDGYYYVCMD